MTQASTVIRQQSMQGGGGRVGLSDATKNKQIQEQKICRHKHKEKKTQGCLQHMGVTYSQLLKTEKQKEKGGKLEV